MPTPLVITSMTSAFSTASALPIEVAKADLSLEGNALVLEEGNVVVLELDNVACQSLPKTSLNEGRSLLERK